MTFSWERALNTKELSFVLFAGLLVLCFWETKAQNNISWWRHTKLLYKLKKSTRNKSYVKLDVRNPIKELTAAFQASLPFLVRYSSSPIKAIAKVPIMNPNEIGLRRSITSPIFVPQNPVGTSADLFFSFGRDYIFYYRRDNGHQ